MARLTRVVIADGGLFRGSGSVNVWMRKVTNEFGVNAVAAAPERTGELKAGIRTTVHHPAPKFVEGAVFSDAKHSLYVIKGTTGPIMSNRAWRQQNTTPGGYITLWKGTGRDRKQVRQRVKGWMPMTTDNPKRAVANWMWAVSGQDSNNFLATAYRRTARKHRALKRGAIPDRIAD
jgi:hypothetical protein